jgi:hypothetical protein
MKVNQISQSGLNLINQNKFYVYEHLKPNTGEVFYIGRGCRNRAFESRSRNSHWKNIVNKYGIDVNIIYKNLSSSEANKKEKELIEFYGLDNLCNMTSGGDCNIVIKKQARDKMSIAKIGNKNALGHSCNNIENKEKMKHYGNTNMLGKKHSIETKLLISKNRKGKILSKESKIKQSESLKLAYIEGRKLKHNLGKQAWNKGISPSKETLEKQRLKKIGVKRKPHSEETKIKMRLAALNRYNGKFTTSA